MLAPNNNGGMPYQTEEKHLTIFPEYFVEVVKLAINCYNNHFLLRFFTNNLLKYLQNVTSKKLVKCHVYEIFGPPRLAPFHIHGDQPVACCCCRDGKRDGSMPCVIR